MAAPNPQLQQKSLGQLSMIRPTYLPVNCQSNAACLCQKAHVSQTGAKLTLMVVLAANKLGLGQTA